MFFPCQFKVLNIFSTDFFSWYEKSLHKRILGSCLPDNMVILILKPKPHEILTNAMKKTKGKKKKKKNFKNKYLYSPELMYLYIMERIGLKRFWYLFPCSYRSKGRKDILSLVHKGRRRKKSYFSEFLILKRAQVSVSQTLPKERADVENKQSNTRM